MSPDCSRRKRSFGAGGVVGQEFHSLFGREDVSDGRWISGE